MGEHLSLAALYPWNQWAWLVIPLVSYGLISIMLFAFGRTDPDRDVVRFFFGQISETLRRITGFPGWAMAGVLSGLLFLLIVVIGFYWDVAWHFDFGRDEDLFTPSHTMILVGLGGLIYAGAIATLFASLDKAEVGLRVGPIRVPWSAMLLFALGLGGVAAFPLDNLWHEAYGIDVTLWSPTHLQLVAGGSLGTIALFLMCFEAMGDARPTALGRGIHVLTGGTILVAMSTFQGEFDFGGPQFQVLYLPLLIMAAAGFSLALGRATLGPGGAGLVVFVYLILRGFLAFSVGGVMHHTVPWFPLYIPSAIAVEAAAYFLGTDRRLRFGLGAGVLVGTVGLVGELAFVSLSGWWEGGMGGGPAQLLKVAVLGPLAAVAAAVLGAGLARVASSATDGDRVPLAALAGAGLVLVAVLAYPLPRNVGDVQAVIRTEMIGDRAVVEVDLQPADAADNATAFAVTSWQGGGTQTALFDEVAPGRYRSREAVPVTGSWKSMVSLQRGDEVMAAPVYLPADPEIGAEEIPLVPERQTAFVRNTELLLREQHDGPATAAIAAYTGLATLVAVWVGIMAAIARKVSTTPPPPPAQPWSPVRPEAQRVPSWS